MALLAYSGMDFEIPASNADNRGMWVGMSGNMQFRTNNGRYGGGGAQGWSNNYSALLFTTSSDTIIIGCATRINALGGSDGAGFKFYNGTTAILTVLFNGASREIVLYSGSYGTVLGTQGNVELLVGDYMWITFKVKFHNSAGTIDVAIDGVTVWSLTGVNTLNSLTVPDRIGLNHNTSFGTTPDWDDLIVCDDTGSAPFNDLLDDMRIVSVFPNADVTADANWTPSTGTTHYTLIDETAGTVLTDYVSSNTFGSLDRYGFTTTTVVGDILAARIVAAGQADTAHTVEFTLHGPIDYVADLSWAGDSTNYMWSKPFDVSADGWELADIDAFEVSMELLS